MCASGAGGAGVSPRWRQGCGTGVETGRSIRGSGNDWGAARGRGRSLEGGQGCGGSWQYGVRDGLGSGEIWSMVRRAESISLQADGVPMACSRPREQSGGGA